MAGANLYPPPSATAPSASSFGAPPPRAPPDVEAAPERDDKQSLTGCCKLADKDERASSLVAVCRQWESAKRHLLPVWAEVGGMTYGDQHGSLDGESGLWKARTPVPERKATRIDLNHLEPIVSDVAALQCQDPPNFKATAGNDSSAAASAQITANDLVWWMWEQDNYDTKNRMLREAAAVYGTSYLFPRWDATAGRLVDQVVGYDMVFDPLTGVPSGMQERREKLREGEFDDAIVSCFAGIPDPCSKDEWDGEGFVIHEEMSLAAASRQYPEHAADFVVSSNPGGDTGAYYDARMHNASPRQGGVNVQDEHAARKVDQWTIFVRTSDSFYRGKWIVVVCGKIVYEEDNPVYPSEQEEAKGETFPRYHWPVWRIAHKVIAGSYFGHGIAVRMIGAQKKLNGVASKKLHMIKRTAHATLVKPMRANFVKTDQVDQQINVPHDLPPNSIYYVQGPGIPQELQIEERLSVEQMERIAGLHAGSRGESEGGDSGTKQRQLFQRDLGRIADAKYRNDLQLAQAFSYKLRVWRRYATTDRTITIVGENNAVSVKQLNMTSIATGAAVVVYQDSQLPKDPAARMLHVKEAVQLKIVDPADPVQRAGLAEAIGLGNFRQFESSLFADRRCAHDENLKMYDGEAPPVEFWHDDLQDLAAHFAEMRSERWIRATTPLPTDDPQAAMQKMKTRATFIAHVQAHQNAIKMKSGLSAPLVPGPGQQPGAPSPSPMGAPPQAPGMGSSPAPDLSMIPPPSQQAPGGPPMQRAAA